MTDSTHEGACENCPLEHLHWPCHLCRRAKKYRRPIAPGALRTILFPAWISVDFREGWSHLRRWLSVLAFGGGVLWHNLNASEQILGAMITLDIVSGVLLAIDKGVICSTKGIHGLLKKSAMVGCVGVLHLLQQNVHFGIPAAEGVALYFASFEGMSFWENMIALGVPMPPKLKQIFEIWKGHDASSPSTPKQERAKGGDTE